jgi:DNA polymerase
MLYIDCETYNTCEPKTLGTYEYARTAQVMITTYAIDDGPVQLFEDDGSRPDLPADLFEALAGDEPIIAHNAMFDRPVLWAYRLAFIQGGVERWRCTMAQAYAHGFPGSLDQLGRVLGLPQDQQKIADGRKLIHRFCKPAPRTHKADRYTKETHPEEWARFCDYAVRDVEALREIHKRLPTWNWRERDIAQWHLDQRINDRGFAVDVDLVAAGANAAVKEKEILADRFRVLTEYRVDRPSQREPLRLYLNERFNLNLEDTKKSSLQPIADDLTADPDLRAICQISIEANKTSTSKYKALLPAVSPDNRFRGSLQYAGAARTRRWAGRLFQPQNLPSRGIPHPDAIETYIKALKAGAHDLLFDDLMLYGSAALRGVVIADQDKKLVVSDLSNIEGRVNAWLAGEDWKLEAFEAFDRGEGPDLYNVTAGSILGLDPYQIGKSDRNVFGKVPDLALGYEGGVGALQTFTKAYGVLMADHWHGIQANLAEHADRAADNYESWGKERAGDMDRVEWLASETVKLAWRARHPRIKSLWWACRDAATRAIEEPGVTFKAMDHLRFKVVGHAGFKYLLCRMPSGNFLVYASPRLEDGAITYLGVDALTRQWMRLSTYGGKLVENACQSVARDILAQAMPAAEEAGYRVVLTVHDELVTEAPAGGDHTAAGLSEILSCVPNWAEGLPLAAAGFETQRYRKD